MEFFFYPRAVALVGASQRRTGANLLYNLQQGFQGAIYPVNPNYSELGGLTCYPSLADTPSPVDLAIVLVPARTLPAVLTACADKGVRGVMIESAGFAEAGREGRALQEQCLDIARRRGLRLWGPNCMGLVDVRNRRFFTFMLPNITSALTITGRISLVVQSGMLSAAFLAEMASRRSVGVNKVCSIGNKCDVDECDLLAQLIADQDTDAIGLYLESIPRGRLFLELAQASPKPLVVLKSGISQRGAKAALSHTASLAGDARLTLGLLAEAGVLLARDFHHLLDLTRTLAMASSLPPQARTAIISPSGGAGIVTCDLLEKHGLRVAELSPASIKTLTQINPDWMQPTNPIDIYPAIERVGRERAFWVAAETALSDPQVDLLLINYFAGLDGEDVNMNDLRDLVRRSGKTLAVWEVGLNPAAQQLQETFSRLGIPEYNELGRAVECLAAAAGWQPPALRRPLPPVPPRVSPPPAEPPAGTLRTLDERESKALLAGWGLPMVAERLAASLEQAQAAAAEWGYPLVLKGLLPGVVHKSELGLVEAQVAGPQQLAEAFARLWNKVQGKGQVLVQPRVQSDYELIVGYLRDPRFGPCLMLGLGGLLAELRPDVTFAAVPLTPERARALLGRLQSKALFQGYRGLAPLDQEALADLLLRLGQEAAARPEVEQVDINPLLIAKGRSLAVDATVILRQGADKD
ncbi:MAG: acetate--CoA ligase family protein [Thermodesulfobacteriota bacterium]